MLLPACSARAAGDGGIGFFLHVPFPPPEVFSRLPWRAQVLEGMLGADIVSFHTDALPRQLPAHVRCSASTGSRSRARRFASATAARCEPPLTRFRSMRAISRTARTGAAVDRALAGLRKQFAGRRLLLGVDRLDYTKGIPERLRAIELLLELRPDLRREITFVQVAVPSRGEIREYRELRAAVEQLVGRINGRFTEPGLDVPVHYLYRGVTPDRLLAYYRAAEVCLVTPLQDGMNLVAKEFVTVAGRHRRHRRPRPERVHRRHRGAARGAPVQSVRPRRPRGHDRASRSSSTRTTGAADSSGWRPRSTAMTSSPGSTRSWRRSAPAVWRPPPPDN